MRQIDIERIKAHGLTEADFQPQPKEEQTTIEDLVEALDILTGIVLGGDE